MHATRPIAVPPDPPAAEPEAAIALPDYLVDTYSWAYLQPRSLRLLDRHVVVNCILWGNYRRLVRAACREFAAGDRVLQAASVYGNLSSRLADKVGDRGFLDVIDIAPLQVTHCRQKLSGRANVRVRVADAGAAGAQDYDGVCCFFLLHEVPDLQKRRIVNALLAAVRPGGKVVFVDYHRPARWHPLRPVMALIFRFLEPFAAGLVSRSIQHFAESPQDFDWHQRTRFAGLYQVVVATRQR
ncbi:MAG: rhodoquinone biosynthesis methyltransferase RquA [Steroidobacteraceae bacterium]|nr:rhodoquinone biosynthesis methyltransferase RquA [Steroidobacteraceae bacterium]